MKVVFVTLSLLASSTIVSAKSSSPRLLAAKAAPGKLAVAAADTCFPSCLESLKALCAPSGTCTKTEPAVQTASSSSYYCFTNGVNIASTASSETRTKPDGTTCYQADVVVDTTGTMIQYLWKNAAGALVATESFDYADMAGRYHMVTCAGSTTVTTVDTSSAACQAEMAQQQPDVETLCSSSATCSLSSRPPGAGGAGGAPAQTGAGGQGGGATPAGGAPGTGGGGAGGSGVSCPTGQLLCDGVCIDPMIDRAHCGGCAGVCSDGYACMQGACTAVNPCPIDGEKLCNGACVDTTSDSKNCGGCGVACPAGQSCVSTVVGTKLVTQCATSCAAGMLMCGTDCKPARDARTCGSCDTACGPTQICCSQPLTQGYACADDPTSTAALSSYTCQTCAAPLSACGNSCVDLNSDVSNCGLCGVQCQNSCDNGKCSQAPRDSGSCAVGPAPGPRGLCGLVAAAFVVAAGVLRRRRDRRPPA